MKRQSGTDGEEQPTLRAARVTGNFYSARFVPVAQRLYRDGMEGNQILKKRMAELGLTQCDLAEALNADQRASGHEGTVSDRTVRNWLTGKTRWPRSRQRAALEAVFNCPVSELGFQPPEDSRPTPSSEDHVRRRRFMNASTAAALAATGALKVAPAHASQPRVGSADVERLLKKFASLVARDCRYGGQVTVEAQACALADEALTLQRRGTAGQRVRDALYGCAALSTSSAMWAAIDGQRFDAALRHFDRAASLAALSGDATVQFRIWSHAGMLYRRLDRPHDALAANDVARALPIARRDPMFASLGHARHAAIHGFSGDRRGVRRALGHAREAFGRADPDEQRPLWLTAFFDQAELESLAMGTYLALGDPLAAEAHAHRSLALLRPNMKRNKAVTTACLAYAQLGQSDVEPAVETAMSIPPEFTHHPRVHGMLHEFGSTLRATAPSSPWTQTWDQFLHDSRKASQ